MDVLVVRTRLQALIARRMLIDGVIASPVHLVLLFNNDEQTFGGGFDYQCELLAPNVARRTVLARPRMGFARVFLTMLFLLWRTRLTRSRFFCASISWYPFAQALRLAPGMRIHTFDDGPANVQQRDSSYLSEAPSNKGGFAGWLARALFPKGPALFVRSRIERHWTIYPGMQNVAPADRLETLTMSWGELLAPDDVAGLPAAARRIYLGTLSEWQGRTGLWSVPRETIDAAIAWSDFYIPHPREPSATPRPDLFRKYPAEAFVDHFARSGPVAVAHHNSSAALSFLRHPNVTLIDLYVHGVDRLPQVDEHVSSASDSLD